MEASSPEMALAHGFPLIRVVEDSFCVPYPTEMTVKKKYHGFFLNQRYEVVDVNGNLLLQVDGSSLSMQKKRIMRDAAGSPILTMREKVWFGEQFLLGIFRWPEAPLSSHCCSWSFRPPRPRRPPDVIVPIISGTPSAFITRSPNPQNPKSQNCKPEHTCASLSTGLDELMCHASSLRGVGVDMLVEILETISKIGSGTNSSSLCPEPCSLTSVPIETDDKENNLSLPDNRESPKSNI